MYLNKQELNEHFNENNRNIVAKQLRRYGTIISDMQYETNQEYVRVLDINHHDSDWTIRMSNGNVTSIAQYPKDVVYYPIKQQEPKMQYVYVLVSKDAQILGVYNNINRVADEMSKNPCSRITQEPVLQ